MVNPVSMAFLHDVATLPIIRWVPLSYSWVLWHALANRRWPKWYCISSKPRPWSWDPCPCHKNKPEHHLSEDTNLCRAKWHLLSGYMHVSVPSQDHETLTFKNSDKWLLFLLLLLLFWARALNLPYVGGWAWSTDPPVSISWMAMETGG